MSFHQYRLGELYSNPSGSIQFIELSVGNANGESRWAGVSISSARNGITNTFNFPADLSSTATANTAVLIATQGFADLGVVVPDFIVPSGFLFTAGGALNFGGVDAITYPALPGDGLHSVTRMGEPVLATPKNFAGATGNLPTQTVLTITGTAGNDTLAGTAHNEVIDGGAGLDTAIFTGTRADHTLTRTASGWTSASPADGIDTIQNVERLQFSDQTLALDIAGSAGQAYRIYQAAFNRVPDNGGLKYWIGRMDAGTTQDRVAAEFIGSQEFQNLYGTNTSNADFLTRLYSNVLHRTPDPGGYSWWLGQLDAGVYDKPSALASFAESNENQLGVIGVIQNGIELFN